MKSFRIRKPAVAGQFYPAAADELKKTIEGLINLKAEKKDALACILPHAGYVYSGKVAGETVSSVKIPDTVILLGPNHTGNGAEFSIMAEGVWQMPMGEIGIDNGLAVKLLEGSKYLEDDELAHLYEHSLEVELPFLQYFKHDFKICPIAIASQDFNKLEGLGREIASVIQSRGLKGSCLLVASSDMTHYEPQGQAQRKDSEAIKAITELNAKALFERVNSMNISMCGIAPVITAITAAKSLGASAAKLIKYQTSGDTTGDKTSVVGYAGIIIY